VAVSVTVGWLLGHSTGSSINWVRTSGVGFWMSMIDGARNPVDSEPRSTRFVSGCQRAASFGLTVVVFRSW
jgi:hypothetical protein